MVIRRVFVALMILVACESPSADLVKGDLGRRIDEYLSRLEKFGFSGVVLVARGGDVALNKGYGLADRARKIPFDSQTVCSIGSITKQFTAAAILKLEMQGTLRVGDPISKYLPDVPPDKAGITIHHLLTHSAGLRGDYGGRDSDPISRDALVKLVLGAPLEALPGRRYEYSNEGYSLLGAIVEIVSGKSYESYLRENLFRPAGMELTGYVLPQWTAGALARGYRDGQEWGTITEKGWKDDGPGWFLKANGGIHSTSGDMYKWHLALEGDSILSADAKKKYFTPHIAEGPRAESFYGYGWAIFTTPRKTRLIAHDGGNGIFAADFRRYVDENVVIYAASNADVSAIDVTEVIPAIIFGGEFAMPPQVIALDQAVLSRYAGTYQFPGGEPIVVTAVKIGLKVSGGGPPGLFALLNYLSPPGGNLYEKLEARSKTIIEAGAAGNYRPIHEAFGGGMPLEEVQKNEAEMWRQRRERFGAFRNAEILGSGRGGPGVVVYVRINCERGGPLARFGWEGERLAGIRMMPGAPEPLFLPESATEFNAFHIRQPRPLRLRFENGDGGAAPKLIFPVEGGQLTAVKK